MTTKRPAGIIFPRKTGNLLKKNTQLGHILFGRVLACHACSPGFEPQNHVKEDAGMAAQLVTPAARRQRLEDQKF